MLYLLTPDLKQARSSGGERYLDTVEVDGSIPSVPTIILQFKNPGMGFLSARC